MTAVKTFKPKLKAGQSVVTQWGTDGKPKKGTILCFVPKNINVVSLYPECKDKLSGLYDASSANRYLVQLENGKYSLPYAAALEKKNRVN